MGSVGCGCGPLNENPILKTFETETIRTDIRAQTGNSHHGESESAGGYHCNCDYRFPYRRHSSWRISFCSVGPKQAEATR
jgi:hypothetical protein